MSRTWQKKQGLIAGCIVAAFHMFFLLYLLFAYRQALLEPEVIIGYSTNGITDNPIIKEINIYNRVLRTGNISRI